LVRGILTLALLAVSCLDSSTAAVSAIISTAAIVVLIVAVAIALVARYTALAGARVVCFIGRIKTLALLAVSFLYDLSTTVSAIILTTALVVVVITVAVALEFG